MNIKPLVEVQSKCREKDIDNNISANGAGFDLFALTLTIGSKNGFPFGGVMVMGGNLNRLAE